MEDLGSWSNWARNSMSFLLALPFSGGAEMLTLSEPAKRPAIRVRELPGTTLTGKSTPSLMILMSISMLEAVYQVKVLVMLININEAKKSRKKNDINICK